MSNQEKPPVRLAVCERCGTLIDEWAPCWVCNYPAPDTRSAPKRNSPLRILAIVLLWLGTAAAMSVALVIGLFVICIFAISA